MAKLEAKRFVFVLIVVHLLIVLPLAWSLNIWADEASTLYSTQHGFFGAFHNAATNEKQAPLYFWAMALWRDLNGSIFFARLFSVICSAVAIKIFAGLASRFFEHRTAVLVTAFFALHPFLIWASLEIRVYAMVVLLVVSLLSLFFRTFVDEKGGSIEYVGFTLLAAVSLYTNYYLAFPLVGMLIALVITRRWKQVSIFLALSAIAGVAFLPILVAAKSQLAVNTGGYQEPRLLFDGLRTLWHRFIMFILPAGVFADGDEGLVLSIRLWAVRIALAVAAIFAIKNRKNLRSRTAILASITAVCFLCLLGGYFVLGPRYLEIRHAAVVFVPLLLTVASLISDLFAPEKESTSRAFLFAGAFLVLLSFAYSLLVLAPNSTKRGDWARIGEYIEDNEQPGQPIVVFQAFDALALPYHYHGVNRIIPNHGYFDYDPEAAFGTVESHRRETDFLISQMPRDADHVWLAVGEICASTSACEPLENYIRSNYTIEREQQFYLEKLYLLRKNIP